MSRIGILPITTKNYPIVAGGMHAGAYSRASFRPGARPAGPLDRARIGPALTGVVVLIALRTH